MYLDIKTAPLVEKLLSDLLTTTDGFQQIKAKNHEMVNELEGLKNKIDPLKIENKRLINENNDLHFKIITLSENNESEKALVQIKILEGEKNDLRFMLVQKDKRINELVSENQELKHKYDALINKMTKGHEAHLNIPKLEQTGKIISELGDIYKVTQLDYKDELMRADETKVDLTNKVRKLSVINDALEKDLNLLKSVIDKRDKEINRLTNLYEPEIHMDKIALNFERESQKRKIDNLETQLEFLNSENNKLTEQ